MKAIHFCFLTKWWKFCQLQWAFFRDFKDIGKGNRHIFKAFSAAACVKLPWRGYRSNTKNQNVWKRGAEQKRNPDAVWNGWFYSTKNKQNSLSVARQGMALSGKKESKIKPDMNQNDCRCNDINDKQWTNGGKNYLNTRAGENTWG